jgi:hypothetical protein
LETCLPCRSYCITFLTSFVLLTFSISYSICSIQAVFLTSADIIGFPWLSFIILCIQSWPPNQHFNSRSIHSSTFSWHLYHTHHSSASFLHVHSPHFLWSSPSAERSSINTLLFPYFDIFFFIIFHETVPYLLFVFLCNICILNFSTSYFLCFISCIIL